MVEGYAGKGVTCLQAAPAGMGNTVLPDVTPTTTTNGGQGPSWL